MNYKDIIMFKSILKNKVAVLLILFFSIVSNAQINIFGDWRIDNVIGIRDLKEYSMVKQEENNRWGSLLTLNSDGTFLSRNLPECGNLISANILGDFVLIDDNHIRFILGETSSRKYNKAHNLDSESDLNRDLGIFYIYKDSKSIRLIESNGVLEDDKNKILYNKLMNSFDWRSYDFVWNNTKGKNQEEIVKDCIDSKKLIDLSNCKVVFSKKEKYGDVLLVQENSNFHFVIYDDFKKKVSLAYPR